MKLQLLHSCFIVSDTSLDTAVLHSWFCETEVETDSCLTKTEIIQSQSVSVVWTVPQDAELLYVLVHWIDTKGYHHQLDCQEGVYKAEESL